MQTPCQKGSHYCDLYLLIWGLILHQAFGHIGVDHASRFHKWYNAFLPYFSEFCVSKAEFDERK